MNEIICTIGKYDIPAIQKQPDFNVDLLKSNVMLFGSSQSGKTNLIKLIINILHKKMSIENECIFILDFGGALYKYQNMPLVSAYFDNSNEEYVKRVFKILETKMKNNTKELKGIGFSQAETQPQHTTFFIDNLNAFLDEPRYSGYHEKFSRICRDGLSKGISIVVTASETKGIMSYINYFSQKIAINLNDEKYSDIFGRKVRSIGNIAGRGFANITLKDEKEMKSVFDVNCPYEIHCNFAEDIESKNFKEHIEDKFKEKTVKKYKIFPSKLTEKEYEKLTEKKLEDDYKSLNKYQYIAGLDYVDFEKVTIDFKESRLLAVYSKKNFGREEFIERIVKRLMESDTSRKLVLFDDGRQQLKNLHNEYKDRTNKYISKFENDTVYVKDSSRNTTLGGILGTGTNIKPVEKKLSPMQQFYKYIYENCIDISPFFNNKMLFCSDDIKRQEDPEPTIFVIQNRLVYSNSVENKKFIEHILQLLMDIAEEKDYIFIFSDVKKIAEYNINTQFNSLIHSVVLLDNIADFVKESGQNTVLNDLDFELLKSDYAKCEFGDGYYYDVEADDLKKLKFIQEKGEDY